ncbi:unnamed protein product [Lactuca saligna]|uniref:Uncharacterized protein n=1 Tax=Lactuca saligna TaxID=75948 RepID=A0AA35YLB4_LACSI|nr:unnamed protein product [Lactuca saligna]
MFVDARVNGGYTKALVDTGASHNFLAEDEAKKLGIKYTKMPGRLKVVNSLSKPIIGVAYGVPLKIAEWEGTIDLIVVHMDDYRMVFGMDFLENVRPWSFERDDTMRITKGSIIHIVPLKRNMIGSRMLSTMQLDKGLKKSEIEFMTTLKEEVIPLKMDIPKENKNMTSPELHKKSHLRRKMEHVMEKLDKAKKKKNTLIRKSKVEFLNRATSKRDEQINKGSRHNMLILWEFSKACKRDNSHAYKFLKGRHKKLHKTVQQIDQLINFLDFFLRHLAGNFLLLSLFQLLDLSPNFVVLLNGSSGLYPMPVRISPISFLPIISFLSSSPCSGVWSAIGVGALLPLIAYSSQFYEYIIVYLCISKEIDLGFNFGLEESCLAGDIWCTWI